MKLLKASILIAASLSFTTSDAMAHAVAIGYTPGASPGQVNLWLGSYHDNGVGDGNDLEGSARLVGLAGATLGYDTTTPFTYSTPSTGGYVAPSPVPAGLVAGTNLFFHGGYNATGIYSWEAVTISGLVAGSYQFSYVPIASPTAHWAPWSTLQGINLTLTSGDVSGGGTNVPSGVPDGGSSIALLGLAMTAAAGFRRKFGI